MADMPMPHVAETLRNFLINTILVTVVVVAIFVGIFVLRARRTITQPLKIISEEAEAFTGSDIKLSERLKDINQPDEIGHLAESIYRMENDIQNYVTNLTKVTAEKERIGAELDVATNIQKSMLPCIFPAFPERPEIDIYATMEPAKEVGGDFYDFFMVDESHVAMVAADVSGKGVPAALFMVIGKTLIKDHTTPGKDLGEVFSEVNNLLTESNAGGLFITCFEAVLDLKTGEFRFVNAGHETPFICKKGGTFEEYKIRAGFVLAGLENTKYKAGSMMLEPGDRIFQYTDGVTEATDANNQLYGMERLYDALNNNKDLALDQLLPAVKADIDKFVGEAPQFDDITMICLEYKQKME